MQHLDAVLLELRDMLLRLITGCFDDLDTALVSIIA